MTFSDTETLMSCNHTFGEAGFLKNIQSVLTS